nr:membrane protein insertion efficiency factor YidD [Geothrix sp. 21YS21S-4]
MADWLLGHPLATIGLYLVAEAFLPVRFQPTAWVCRGLIRTYQATLSSHLPTQCKFTPTCSHYGLGCIRKYGTLRGGLLTSWRLVRCSPLTDGGPDPIP